MPYYMTLAPEMFTDDVLDILIDGQRPHAIKLSVGHSDATFEQASAAMARGIPRVTHLFNAMSQWQVQNSCIYLANFHRKHSKYPLFRFKQFSNPVLSADSPQ